MHWSENSTKHKCYIEVKSMTSHSIRDLKLCHFGEKIWGEKLVIILWQPDNTINRIISQALLHYIWNFTSSNTSDFFYQFKNSLGRILHCSLVEENVSNAKCHTPSVCWPSSCLLICSLDFLLRFVLSYGQNSSQKRPHLESQNTNKIYIKF